jgi:hypothetical protein
MIPKNLIYMADGLFVVKGVTDYICHDENGRVLKVAKTIKSIDRYVQKELEAKRFYEKNHHNKPYSYSGF